MVISGETRLVALLGHPVAHSLSPRMQNAAFAARALDWAYVAVDVPPERLDEAVRGLAALGFAGANVTAPHKLAVAELCDEADAESVNTLLFHDGRVHGTSTDAAVLEGLSLGRVSIVGDGGAARAFRTALPDARVFSRRRRLAAGRSRCGRRRPRDPGARRGAVRARAQGRRSSSFPTRTPRRRAPRATPARR